MARGVTSGSGAAVLCSIVVLFLYRRGWLGDLWRPVADGSIGTTENSSQCCASQQKEAILSMAIMEDPQGAGQGKRLLSVACCGLITLTSAAKPVCSFVVHIGLLLYHNIVLVPWDLFVFMVE